MSHSLGPLGKTASFPSFPDANVLFAVPRSKARTLAGLEHGQLAPFGHDIFTAWEFCWRNAQGRPQIAVLRLVFDVTSPNLVESKSLKLYLHGYAHERFEHEAAVIGQIQADLAAKSGSQPRVALLQADDAALAVVRAPEPCIDELWLEGGADDAERKTSPDILQAEASARRGALVSHTFGSLCPVTGQPDWASIRVAWEGIGPRPESFLRYLSSFRRHQGFHEACVDMIFAAISEQCRPDRLCVLAQFTRRGGIEIAPVRGSSSELLHWVRLFRL